MNGGKGTRISRSVASGDDPSLPRIYILVRSLFVLPFPRLCTRIESPPTSLSSEDTVCDSEGLIIRLGRQKLEPEDRQLRVLDRVDRTLQVCEDALLIHLVGLEV